MVWNKDAYSGPDPKQYSKFHIYQKRVILGSGWLSKEVLVKVHGSSILNLILVGKYWKMN